MSICAVIDSTNTVINVIVCEPTDIPPEGCQLIDVTNLEGLYSIGCKWNGTTFTDFLLEDYSYGG